jgi:sulfoxide reductase heme-binding subunit YedZ
MTLWYLMRASGLVTFVLLSITVVLGIRGARTRGRSGTVATLVHRNASLLAVIFLAIHVVTAVTDRYVTIPLPAVVVPGVSDYRAFWMALGAVALDLMVALILTSLLRVIIGRRTWRALHWLAYATWPVALAHSIGTGTDTGRAWTTVIYALSGTSVIAAASLRAVRRRPAGPTRIGGRRPPPAPLDARPWPVTTSAAVPTRLVRNR